MGLKQLFYTIFKSVNPDSYDELNEQSIPYALKYFFFITFISILVMFILFIPIFFSFPAFFDQKTANFEKLDLNLSFALKEPINLLSDPLIRVGNPDDNITDARLLITEDSIYYKSFFLFGKTKSIPLETNINIKSSETIKSGLMNLLLFLLPSFIFWSIIFFCIYFFVVILFTFLLALLIVWAFRMSISALSLFKTSIYASTIMIALQLIIMPFYRIIFIPVFAYWILMLIIILLLKDEKRSSGKSNVFAEESYGSKHKDVFSKHSKEDSVNSDEHGNMQSSVKKHKKSFEEENDGYVMMK